MEIRETQEQIEHAKENENKRVAILIVALAAALAIVEIAGKEAQFTSIAMNIESSDVYSFYQAKTIRQTVAETALESAQLAGPAAGKEADWQKQIAAWKERAEQLGSDAKTGNGRQELLAKAKDLERERDHENAAYHDFEYGSAAIQLAIVIASAGVITERRSLEWIAMATGLLGVVLAGIGWLAPEVLGL